MCSAEIPDKAIDYLRSHSFKEISAGLATFRKHPKWAEKANSVEAEIIMRHTNELLENLIGEKKLGVYMAFDLADGAITAILIPLAKAKTEIVKKIGVSCFKLMGVNEETKYNAEMLSDILENDDH